MDTGINLLTLGEVKAFIEGSTTGTTTYDGNYENIIDAVSLYFNNYTGRHLKSAACTEYYDGNDAREMVLNQYPITSTDVVVTIDPTYSFTTDYRVDTSDVQIYAGEGKIWLYDDWFTGGNRNVKVVYTAGYSSSQMPGDLKRAALETALVFWNREDKKDRVGVRTESFEGGSRTYETDIPWGAKQVLDYYRCKRFW
jgi:hypothetical protein